MFFHIFHIGFGEILPEFEKTVMGGGGGGLRGGARICPAGGLNSPTGGLKTQKISSNNSIA